MTEQARETHAATLEALRLAVDTLSTAVEATDRALASIETVADAHAAGIEPANIAYYGAKLREVLDNMLGDVFVGCIHTTDMMDDGEECIYDMRLHAILNR